MKISVLCDDRAGEGFLSEHGLSLFIETDGLKILFDSGQSGVFAENAERLGIDPLSADAAVLSHGDYDHANGFGRYFPQNKIPFYAHSDIFEYRVSKTRNGPGGMDMSRSEVEERFDAFFSTEPIRISENIFFLGQIPRRFGFESGGLPMTDRDGNVYPCLDDSGLAILTGNGLVLVSGCAHSGICSMAEYAAEVTGESRLYAAAGGFHLRTADEKTARTAEYFRSRGCRHILLMHCTSDAACSAFEKELPGAVRIARTGASFEI